MAVSKTKNDEKEAKEFLILFFHPVGLKTLLMMILTGSLRLEELLLKIQALMMMLV